MKNLLSIIALLGILTLQTAFSQPNTHLKLSETYPSIGKKITVTYNPTGTVLQDKSNLNAAVYFFDNKDYPVADIDLKPKGKLLKGDFIVPNTAKAFFIKISKDEFVDDNQEKGYLYMVYKDKKPVSGAYASKAFVLFTGIGQDFAKIKTDKNEAFLLYSKEFQLYPEIKNEYKADYYSLLGMSTNPEFANSLNKELNSLIKSDQEKDLLLAITLLNIINKKPTADSLTSIIKSKYPNGEFTSKELATAFNNEKDLVKKEALYYDYIKKFPESTTEKKTVQDNFRMQLAGTYLRQGKIDDYKRWENQIKDKSNLASGLNNVASGWVENGKHLEEAATISKQSLDLTKQQIINPGQKALRSPKMLKQDYEFSYDTYADTYAFILFKQNKFKEALSYEQPVYEKSKGNDADVDEHFALILKAAGEEQKAKQVIETAIKNGKSSESMNADLKAMYIKAKGSDTGYDQYFASLKNAAANAAREKLAKEMINKPAPVFALKDFDGNTVSLASLKGKVVVIDFWATWCGPCKASFPGMQLAVNKYKDNPNVEFLFIDTWENSDGYLPGVKKFIADKHYTFNVLMDEKGDDNRQSKVVSAFGVDGIPTKFVLDKNGNIRFKKVGFEGTAESIKDEVSSMIELVSEADLTKPEKVSMLK
ncbi:TlpA disulfide reductase family protein [Mucilaginibacter arboris]|uniref:Redoxin domain-containing protein n=1 Tax=Mucilaginibacter arboris TaxID=2682090 RepID=A0A7K1SYP5_9SPHI|nr:TlpA disulfide reductase family protein [Mucilaginibacter arboris]MVN22432.1 redoxin domain-containing protein [Mucilaginibacter arboris]